MVEPEVIETFQACLGAFRAGSGPAAPLANALAALKDDLRRGGEQTLLAVCVAAEEALGHGLDGEGGGDPATLDRKLSELQGALAAWISTQDGGVAEAAQFFDEGLGLFLASATGVIADIEDEILAIESSGQKAGLLDNFRRLVHTLKAEFGVLGLDTASDLCHAAEDMVDRCAADGAPFPVDAMLGVVDWVKGYAAALADDPHAQVPDAGPVHQRLAQVGADGPAAVPAAPASGSDAADAVDLSVNPDFADTVGEFLAETQTHLAQAEEALADLAADATAADAVHRAFRAFHTVKGVAGFLDIRPLVAVTHAAEAVLDRARSGSLVLELEHLDLLHGAASLIDRIGDALGSGGEGPSVGEVDRLLTLLRAASADPAADTAGASATVAPAASAVLGAVADGAASPPPLAGIAPRDAGNGERPARPAARAVERTVKVNTARLDALVDMVGELVIAQFMVLQDPALRAIDSGTLARNISEANKITRDLQEAVMSLRMVTVRSTFQKMARLVRDVAVRAGKRVELTVVGEDTELDRNVVEQIADPLVHMIRNAVDHGVEPPDERLALGKDPVGRLVLKAHHQGSSIVIEIHDDGRGMDPARIHAKAVERGILPPESSVADMTAGEVFQLIFHPGFSTAEKVTDISGRGVGMDVVRKNIEALRGKVEIESQTGAGTVFRMRLPLTLAIIDGMVVRVGGERYVLPILSIHQSFRPALEDVHRLADRGECVRCRDGVLPVHRLKELIHSTEGEDDLDAGILVIVEMGSTRCCLFVDEILGQQQVVIKALDMPVQGGVAKGVCGGAIMGDGRVALILDVPSLVSEAVLR